MQLRLHCTCLLRRYAVASHPAVITSPGATSPGPLQSARVAGRPLLTVHLTSETGLRGRRTAEESLPAIGLRLHFGATLESARAVKMGVRFQTTAATMGRTTSVPTARVSQMNGEHQSVVKRTCVDVSVR